jgi:hypothetical protein
MVNRELNEEIDYLIVQEKELTSEVNAQRNKCFKELEILETLQKKLKEVSLKRKSYMELRFKKFKSVFEKENWK